MSDEKTFKILLIDDDKDMCESLADVLMFDSHYTVDYNTDPEEALKNIVNNNTYDLMIIDYKMPKMDGMELLRKIKVINPKVHVFILTAFISNELVEHAKKEGATRILSKFIWPDEILQNIKEVIG